MQRMPDTLPTSHFHFFHLALDFPSLPGKLARSFREPLLDTGFSIPRYFVPIRADPGTILRRGCTVSEPSLRRLPRYYEYLKALATSGQEVISAAQISRDLELDATQVRKDLAATGLRGKPKVGHRMSDLIEAIERFLRWDNVTEAFLAGAGSMGTALLGSDRLLHHGIRIVAAFDVDPIKIGHPIHGCEVLPIAKLPGLAQRMGIPIGIITTPAHAAQAVAEFMLDGGIRAIWNFAPVRLTVPRGVIVQNEDLYSGIAVLSRRLAESLAAQSQASSR